MRAVNQFIDYNLSTSEIVRNNYRTAVVFNKYGIEYCCGGKWPLKMVLEDKNLDALKISEELKIVTRDIHLSSMLPFNEWDIDFLTDYIIHIHHDYLRRVIPGITVALTKFVNEHDTKFPYLRELNDIYEHLSKGLLPHLQEEEEIIFPYIRQIAHAYINRDSYASLLVRTLRKPVEEMMHHEHSTMEVSLNRMRRLSNDYQPPEKACISHQVCFALLKELDNDIVQHMYLENEILFPRAISMENELLRIA
jgi:regulator of cell morphogenesis and NO signaling